jgi:hypothetical protein
VDHEGIHGQESPDWPDSPDSTDGPDPADEPTLALPGLTGVPDEPEHEPTPRTPEYEPTPHVPEYEPTLEIPVVIPRRGPRWPAVIAAAAALALVGLLIMRSGRTPPAPHVVSPPSGTWESGPAAGTFEIAGGAATIRLRTAAVAGGLYQVRPAGARVTEAAGVLRLDPDHAPVDVTLAEGVRWRLRIGGGTDLTSIDLSGARLAAVDLAGDASAIDLTLPRPDGTLTVRMTGGVNRFDVHTAQQVPVRVRVGSGAGRVVLDGLTHDGVAAGASFTPARWAHAANRIDVDAVAGMSALTVASY